MRKFPIFALVATLVAMSSMTAQAFPGGPGGFAPGGNGPGGWGGPGGFAPNPGGPGGGGGGGGGGGAGGATSPGDAFVPQLAACGGELGDLRGVSAAQIQGVGEGHRVDVVSICSNRALSDQQDNIAALRPHIASNDVLDQELGMEGFGPTDVVGVMVNGRAVTLYVH